MSRNTGLAGHWTTRGDDAAARRAAEDARYWEAPGRWRGDSLPPAAPTQPSPSQPPASGPPRRRLWFVILPVGLIVWAITQVLGGHHATTVTCTTSGQGTATSTTCTNNGSTP